MVNPKKRAHPQKPQNYKARLENMKIINAKKCSFRIAWHENKKKEIAWTHKTLYNTYSKSMQAMKRINAELEPSQKPQKPEAGCQKPKARSQRQKPEAKSQKPKPVEKNNEQNAKKYTSPTEGLGGYRLVLPYFVANFKWPIFAGVSNIWITSTWKQKDILP